MTFERKVVLSQKPDPYEVFHQQIRYGNFITIHHLSNCTRKDICIVLIWNTSTKGFSSLTLSITSICCSTVARTSFITMFNFFSIIKNCSYTILDRNKAIRIRSFSNRTHLGWPSFSHVDRPSSPFFLSRHSHWLYAFEFDVLNWTDPNIVS